MGQEIEDARFSPRDFREFSRRLQRETELLGRWLEDGVILHEGTHASLLTEHRNYQRLFAMEEYSQEAYNEGRPGAR